ncbi:uncharacterized protein LOC135091203 [Scylla paramamosain]|uniref:uncharacterized protein LOC135091203 n=1 Tax=Scylla paramamosain TaxID=85552 RepID=UPI003082B266
MDSSSGSKKRKAEASASGSHSRRQQRYRMEWEIDPAFKPWLQETTDQYKARCKICNVTMTAELSAKKKKKIMQKAKNTSYFKFTTDKYQPPVARVEIKLAGILAAHNVPFKVMGHLSEALRDIFSDSNIAQEFAMKRTKATAVVTNAIGKSYYMWLSEKLVAAEQIFNSLRDPFIKLYYYFLDWILPKFTNFNKYFQSDKPAITVLHEKISSF